MPTERQKRVAQILMENSGKSVSQAMKEAGYKGTRNPQQLTRSKGWQELMEQYLPDHLLAQTHHEGLKATRPFSSHTEPDKEVPDYAVREKYLDLAYKVKRKVTDEGSPQQHLHVHLDMSKLTPEQIEKFAQSGVVE